MKKDTINLLDTIKIFKKNLKAFYIFIFLGIFFGLIGTLINTNYIESKSNFTLKVSIKNPLKNYYILDLLTLDSIYVNERGVSIKATSEKIANYYEITNQYLDILIQTINLEDYNLNSLNIKKITSEKKDLNFILRFESVLNAEETRKNISNLSNDLNPLISPIFFQNIDKETKNIEYFLKTIVNNPNTTNLQKLSLKLSQETLFKLRKDTLKLIEKRDIEIFETNISESKTKKINNIQIVIFTILLSLSMFLLFIILKR